MIVVPGFGCQVDGRQYVELKDLIAGLYKAASHPDQDAAAAEFARKFAHLCESAKITKDPQ